MKRGELWTVGGGADYAGKPRPALILQDDGFAGTASVTVCPLTTTLVDAPLLRLRVDPSADNGLRAVSQLMVDKITTISRKKVDSRIGRLSEDDVLRLNRAVIVFLGLAGARQR